VIDPLFHKFEPLDKEHATGERDSKLTWHAGCQFRASAFSDARPAKKATRSRLRDGLGASKPRRRVGHHSAKIKQRRSSVLLSRSSSARVGHVWKGLSVWRPSLCVYLVSDLSRIALDAGALGRIGSSWLGRLGFASRLFSVLFQLIMFLASPVVNGHPDGGTRRGCVWLNDSPHCAKFGKRSRRTRFRFLEKWISRIESAASSQILALLASTGCERLFLPHTATILVEGKSPKYGGNTPN